MTHIWEFGEIHDYDDHQSFDPYLDWVHDLEDEGDQTDYDDFNGFYNMSLSSKTASDAQTYLDQYQKQFIGRKWLPSSFFKKAYLRDVYRKTRKFIDELKQVDLTKLPYQKKFKAWLKRADLALRKADRLYEKDQFSTLMKVVEALEIGRLFVQELKYLDANKRLGE